MQCNPNGKKSLLNFIGEGSYVLFDEKKQEIIEYVKVIQLNEKENNSSIDTVLVKNPLNIYICNCLQRMDNVFIRKPSRKITATFLFYFIDDTNTQRDLRVELDLREFTIYI